MVVVNICGHDDVKRSFTSAIVHLVKMMFDKREATTRLRHMQRSEDK